MSWKDPQTRPSRNILKEYVSRPWNLRDKLWFNIEGTRELGWKETRGIQNTDTEDSKGNIIVDERWVVKMWENYITELYDRTNRPENLQAELEEEVGADEEVLYIL